MKIERFRKFNGYRFGVVIRQIEVVRIRSLALAGAGVGIVKNVQRTDEVLACPDPVEPRRPGLERKAARASLWAYSKRRPE